MKSMGLSWANSWDTYERDMETLVFSVADQEGNEIVTVIVTGSVCVTVPGISPFYAPVYPQVSVQASPVLVPVRAQ